MHRGMGLDVFNEMPMRRAVHALYECCHSVPLAADLARARPYADHDSLFRHADQLLFGLAEQSVDSILHAYPDVVATVAGLTFDDAETERKAIRNELARISRTRLERMLGPEGGYDNW